MNLPRGIRNNNPGNIRWGSNWQGLVEQTKRTDPDFCQFKEPLYGLRAMVKVILTYQTKYGLNTVESIIHRYAPPNENNTQQYINRVCDALGVLPKQKLELTTNVLEELLKAIIAVENGYSYYNYYSILLLERAIAIAQQ